MKRTNFFTSLMALVVLLPFLVGCNNNTLEPLKKNEIKNTALAAVLKSQGYTVEGNMLVMDEKAQNTTALDLSSCGLADVSGLEVFPKLEEVNLAKNGLGPAFDFASLPATIKRVDLSDNEIYDYLNLATTNYEKGEYTLIRGLDKLTLPAVAKYNIDNLPAFLKTAPKCDMQMQNKEGKLEQYTTLREVPDPVMRKYLKETFPSKFEGDKLDILKRLNLEQAGEAIFVGTWSWYADPKFEGLKQLDGVEYIINDSQYEGEITLFLDPSAGMQLPYLKPGKKVVKLRLFELTTPMLDMSNAQSIIEFQAIGNKELKSLDLSASKQLMQRSTQSHQSFTGDFFAAINCPLLESITFPDVSKAKSPVSLYGIVLVKLPKLKAVDLSKIQVIQQLNLGGLNCDITYPVELLYFTNLGNKAEDGRIHFNLTKDVYDKPSTKAFIDKYINDKRFMTSGKHSFDDLGFEDIVGYDYLAGKGLRAFTNEVETSLYNLLLPQRQGRLK